MGRAVEYGVWSPGEHQVPTACLANCPEQLTTTPAPPTTPASLCSENHHVDDHVCVACPAGTINAAGDDASGSGTSCSAIKCLANQRVLSNSCQSCPVGTSNTAGDDASGSNTVCTPIICETNQHVESNSCHAC